jgi:signal transduction histidine kinase
MKNYSYNFDDDRFDIEILPYNNQKFYELQQDENNFFIFIDADGQHQDILKIFYPKQKFLKQFSSIKNNLIFQFILFSIVAILISLLFSFYSLYPLQKSYTILKEFIKDIIHDINTPISAIKLNLSLIDKKDDEIIAIEQSTNTLQMLHKILDNYLNNPKPNLAQCSINEILMEQINFFMQLYDYLDWQIDIKDMNILTDKYMLSRVVYNLLNNSCKYNTSKGFIKVTYKNNILTIQNSSYGIKNTTKVFDRFYKESNRGLGIGLHIVAKLLQQLNYSYSLDIDQNNIVTHQVTIR